MKYVYLIAVFINAVLIGTFLGFELYGDALFSVCCLLLCYMGWKIN